MTNQSLADISFEKNTSTKTSWCSMKKKLRCIFGLVQHGVKTLTPLTLFHIQKNSLQFKTADRSHAKDHTYTMAEQNGHAYSKQLRCC